MSCPVRVRDDPATLKQREFLAADPMSRSSCRCLAVAREDVKRAKTESTGLNSLRLSELHLLHFLFSVVRHRRTSVHGGRSRRSANALGDLLHVDLGCRKHGTGKLQRIREDQGSNQRQLRILQAWPQSRYQKRKQGEEPLVWAIEHEISRTSGHLKQREMRHPASAMARLTRACTFCEHAHYVICCSWSWNDLDMFA